jgi:NADPH:quinone reductase-like Zn-dependent oxidoreductase
MLPILFIFMIHVAFCCLTTILIRYLGINLFGPTRELFWVRFSLSSEHLKKLAKYCESGDLSVFVAESFPFTTKGVQQAYTHIMSRRTVGKLCIDMDSREDK